MKAKDVIIEIIAVADGEFHSKVALYKAFYYAHLFYWREFEGTLTDHPIVRMPHGPGIDNGNEILQRLQEEGQIRITRDPADPYGEFSFKLDESVMKSRSIDTADPCYRCIEKAVAFVKRKTAQELSQLTHEHSRSWEAASDGEELNIYLDLMDDEEYLAVKRRLKEADEVIEHAFS
jgi:uncharacterized phage-associated protein